MGAWQPGCLRTGTCQYAITLKAVMRGSGAGNSRLSGIFQKLTQYAHFYMC